jgi:hypothetical protein
VYTPEIIKDIVEYARVRGVRVLPELDAPAHVGNGWQFGEREGMGRLALCVNQAREQPFLIPDHARALHYYCFVKRRLCIDTLSGIVHLRTFAVIPKSFPIFIFSLAPSH